MGETSKKYKDLTAEEKLRVIGWAIKGLLRIIEEAVKNMAYSCAVADMMSRQIFDHEQIWELLPPRTQQHFEHMKPYLVALRCERDRILREEVGSYNEQVDALFLDDALIMEDSIDDVPSIVDERTDQVNPDIENLEVHETPKSTPVAPKVRRRKGNCRGR